MDVYKKSWQISSDWLSGRKAGKHRKMYRRIARKRMRRMFGDFDDE